MSNRNYSRGSSFENSVANRLDNHGFLAVRAAGSGTAPRASADVVGINSEVIALIECKTHGNEQEGNKFAVDEAQLRSISEKSGVFDPEHDEGREVKVMVVMKNTDGGITEYFDFNEIDKIVPGDGRSFYKFLNEHGDK